MSDALPRVEFCFARSNINRGLVCGKPKGHLATDPFHKFMPGDPRTHEWLDHDTFRATAWCHGTNAHPAHEVTTPVNDGLCMSCEVNLSHELDQREGLR